MTDRVNHGDLQALEMLSRDPELAQIGSLCDTLARCSRTVSSIGYLKCRQDDRHELHTHASVDQMYAAESISLFELLSQERNPLIDPATGKRFHLSRKDRLVLAVRISTTLLQLYSTPWIPKDWGKNDIVLLLFHDSLSDRVLSNSPYLRHEFSTRNPSTGDSTTESDTQAFIFRLGVLLLELCTGEPVEDRLPSFSKSTEIQHLDVEYFRNFTKIYEWWKQEAVNAEGDRVAEAIRRCLCFDFACDVKSLLYPEFRNLVYTTIVQPLDEVLSHFLL
jgi:hypothetical protein